MLTAAATRADDSSSRRLFLPQGRPLNPSLLSCIAYHCCFDPWRRRRLKVDGARLQLDKLQVELTPTAEVLELAADKIAAYDW